MNTYCSLCLSLSLSLYKNADSVQHIYILLIQPNFSSNPIVQTGPLKETSGLSEFMQPRCFIQIWEGCRPKGPIGNSFSFSQEPNIFLQLWLPKAILPIKTIRRFKGVLGPPTAEIGQYVCQEFLVGIHVPHRNAPAPASRTIRLRSCAAATRCWGPSSSTGARLVRGQVYGGSSEYSSPHWAGM